MTAVTFALVIMTCVSNGDARACTTLSIYQKDRDICEANPMRIAETFIVRKHLCLPLIGATVD